VLVGVLGSKVGLEGAAVAGLACLGIATVPLWRKVLRMPNEEGWHVGGTAGVVGLVLLMLAGFSQSLSQVPMAAILLRNSDPQFRGRVMGIRMLAIYGNVPGLLISGPLIASFGYPLTASLFCAVGITATLIIAVRWRACLWRRAAPANLR
jgi:hypothetical protein